MSTEYVCSACGFRVPAGDHVGVALMQAHLREHVREVPSTEPEGEHDDAR